MLISFVIDTKDDDMDKFRKTIHNSLMGNEDYIKDNIVLSETPKGVTPHLYVVIFPDTCENYKEAVFKFEETFDSLMDHFRHPERYV